MISSLVEQSWKHLRYMVENVGPRPAGSQRLKSALHYAEDLLVGWGYSVSREPLTYSRRLLPGLLVPAVGFGLIVGGWMVDSSPWFVVWFPLLGPAIPQISRWWIRIKTGDSASENLVGWLGDKDDQEKLLLTAHLDTAEALPFQHPFLIRVQHQTLFFYQRFAVGLGLLGGFRLLGMNLIPQLWAAVGTLFTLAGGWLLLSGLWLGFHPGKKYSPGANDNASGAAVLLALAEYFKDQPPQGFQLGFGFLDGEETGLDGARALARTLNPERVQVLNLDMVGAGDQLRFVFKDGTLFPLKTDQKLNQLIQTVCPRAKPLHQTRRTGDYRPFLLAGIPAASLEISGSWAARTAYHTQRDNLDLIETGALQLAIETGIKLIKSLDQPSVG